MTYAAYKRALRADIETARRAKVYFEALYDREHLRRVSSIARVADEATYDRGLHEGKTHDDMAAAARLALRVYAITYASLAKRSILKRLDIVTRLYFKRVAKHRRLPLVSYDALTKQSVIELRSRLTSVLTLPAAADPHLVAMSTDEWIRKLRGFQKALDTLKETARGMSEKIVVWEKAIDDKSRLNLALIGLAITIALFLFREAKEVILYHYYPQGFQETNSRNE